MSSSEIIAIFVAAGSVITGLITGYLSIQDRLQKDNKKFFYQQKGELEAFFDQKTKFLNGRVKELDEQRESLLLRLSQSEEARDKMREAFDKLDEKYNENLKSKDLEINNLKKKIAVLEKRLLALETK